jgi:hypothetical protein
MKILESAKLPKLLFMSLLMIMVMAGLLFSSGCSLTSSSCSGTGTIEFENHASHSSYDILLDGSLVGSIGPGQSMTRTVTAVVQHTVLFRFSNTNQNACSEAQESVIECHTNTISCDAELSSSPTPTSSTCTQYHTGTIRFENRASHSSYDIILDGISIGSIGPGQSMNRTVTAVEKHSVLFRFSNTNQNACSEAQESVIECYTQTIWCDTEH